MGAAKKLAANVWVDGELYLAGSSPEKAVADQITNEKAWASASADDSAPEPAEVVVTGVNESEDAAPAPAKKTAAKKTAAKK